MNMRFEGTAKQIGILFAQAFVGRLTILVRSILTAPDVWAGRGSH